MTDKEKDDLFRRLTAIMTVIDDLGWDKREAIVLWGEAVYEAMVKSEG